MNKQGPYSHSTDEETETQKVRCLALVTEPGSSRTKSKPGSDFWAPALFLVTLLQTGVEGEEEAS